MPDRIWVADWNGRADVASSYVRSDGWARTAGCTSTAAGTTRPTAACGSTSTPTGSTSAAARRRPRSPGTAVARRRTTTAATPPAAVGDRGALVRTVQCLLRGRGAYTGTVDGVYDAGLGAAVRRYRTGRGLPAGTSTTPATWVALLSQGDTPLVKAGSASVAVRQVQRALNAADGAGLTVTGVFDPRTTAAVKRYQGDHRRARTGVVTPALWRLLQSGTR